MGTYDTYEGVQMKAAEDKDGMDYYKVGDKVSIPDGVYVGHEGVVVIVGRIFAAKFDNINDKWGGTITPKALLEPVDPFRALIKEPID